MNLKDIGAILALAALWGASFIFIRIASPAIGPLTTIQWRVGVASLALLLFILLSHRTVQWKRWWKQYLILGAMNAALPFTFIATAELYLNASMSSILNALTPLFTVLVAWGGLKEKITVKKWIGILIGIFGVLILVGWSPLPLTQSILLAIGLSLLSTISYAFAGVYAKKVFTHVPPLSLAAGQQIGATLVLLPFTLIGLPYERAHYSWSVILSVLGLSLFCTAIAYLLYFYLIGSVGPTKTLTVTLLIPFFGMAWDVALLHEKVTIGMLVGLLVIIGSITLISDIPLHLKRQATKNALVSKKN
jgi:drug/metabolite transporter (DMT)-like permease